MDTIIKTLRDTPEKKVNLVISDKNWLESSAVDQLKSTSDLPGIHFAVGMPDLHPGRGQPIGAAFVSKNIMYPHLVGSDIGCGMAVFKLNVTKNKVKLDKWEKKLIGLDDEWLGDVDSWLYNAGIHSDDSFVNTENNKIGTIGGGNHFCEFQTPDKVFDEQQLFQAGLNKKSVILLAHSGSRGLGQKILREHTDNDGSDGLSSENDRSKLDRYLTRHNYATAWAKANRALIAKRFCDCLNVKYEYLLDVAHNTVQPLGNSQVAALGLSHTDVNQYGKEPYWIHRKGVSPTDEGLVMIPGSRGSSSYLVKPRTDMSEKLASAGFSLAHGAGRKWKRSDAKGRLASHFKFSDLLKTPFGSRVICQNRNLIYEEAPQAYKNIDLVIADLIDAQLIYPIASFKPLITYKTRKK